MPKKGDAANPIDLTIRPVAKAILKAGLSVYDVAEEGAAEVRKQLADLVAEVREEMNGDVKRKASSKKRSYRRRRSKKSSQS